MTEGQLPAVVLELMDGAKGKKTQQNHFRVQPIPTIYHGKLFGSVLCVTLNAGRHINPRGRKRDIDAFSREHLLRHLRCPHLAFSVHIGS